MTIPQTNQSIAKVVEDASFGLAYAVMVLSVVYMIVHMISVVLIVTGTADLLTRGLS